MRCSGGWGLRTLLPGNPGNSCIHLTDEQSDAVLLERGKGRPGAGGFSCDESYAYTCARCLLNPGSVDFLNSAMASSLALDSAAFREAWTLYTDWLEAPAFDDRDDGDRNVWRAPPSFFAS